MEPYAAEALKAKVYAEKHFAEGDFMGARNYALKAQMMCPQLVDISQMVATFGVYTASEVRINGELDLYGILGLEPSADKSLVAKQYRKMALLLHPDMNKSVGADGAFKYASDAWIVLSDHVKRSMYDQRRNVTALHAPGNGSYINYSNPLVASNHRMDTFWTLCTSCHVQYEYLRKYANKVLSCKNCHSVFIAAETGAAPASGQDLWATYMPNNTSVYGTSLEKIFLQPDTGYQATNVVSWYHPGHGPAGGMDPNGFPTSTYLNELLECVELISQSPDRYQPELYDLKEHVICTHNIFTYLGNKFKDDILHIGRLKIEEEKIRIIASEAEYWLRVWKNQQRNAESVKEISNGIKSYNKDLLCSFEPKLLDNPEVLEFTSFLHQDIDRVRDNFNRSLMIPFSSSSKQELTNKIVDFILAKPLYYLEFIHIGGKLGLQKKEAIARLIYDDSRIQNQFPVRLWLSVESDYSVHELLHALALSISNWLEPILQLELVELLKFWKENMLKVERLGKEEERLRDLIFTVFRNKEYLVVIDKIKSLRTWDGIKSLFYNTEKGGIVFFMSTNVPDLIVGLNTEFRLQGSLLSVDNFHHVIFGNRSCPQELKTSFLAIYRCCRGITPAVFMVANYLCSIDHSRDNWLKVQQRLASTLPMFKDKTVGTVSALMKASMDIDYIHTVSTSIGHSDRNLELETKQQEIIKCNEYFLCVELQESLKQLLLDLTESSKKLKRMGIVGMAGIGKTTIAKILYEHPVVVQNFDRQAWIKISLSHCRRDLLAELLQCINEHSHDIGGKTESDLEEDLWRSLKHQRYLIVVDDLWSVADWNGIRRIFPDDNSGSRILFTSRQSNVIEGLKCEKIHHMSLLDEQTSWDLMQKKVFGQDITPPDLVDIGKQIAKKCQGLPLVIVVIAGVLMTITKTFESWKAVEESITSTVMSSANRCKELFALSYNHLPCHLKSCFLYMGAFQGGGTEIESRTLARFWIAEGFIIPKKLKSLEQTAEEYLKDLIDRSLVLTARKRSNGKVKTCRLHDLLLEFCINQARMETFFEVVKDSKEEKEEEDEDGLGELPSAGKKDRPCRFSFHCQTFEDITPKSKAGAAFFTVCPREVPDIFFYTLDFKLLFILDMIPLRFDSFPVDQISKLLLLKYLAFTASFELPAVVFRLPKLQTLIINDSRIKSDTTPAPALPHDFWQCMKLRHLQLQEAHYLPPSTEFLRLRYLQTLSKVTLASCSTPKTFAYMPNLIKLVVCETMEDFQSDHLWNIFFENLIHLSKLQILKAYCLQMRNSSIRQLPIPRVNAFPETLRKLTLSRSHMPWERMKILGELPNLEVLKLRNYAFEGPEWETDGEGFQRLEYLLIENTDLQRWEWECDDCFPSLKHLVLKYCHLLEDIPEQIGDCPDLTHIQLRHCSNTAEESAKYIQTQQLEECLHNIEVHIQSKLARNQSTSVEELKV